MSYSLHLNIKVDDEEIEKVQSGFRSINEAHNAYVDFISPYYRNVGRLKGRSFIIDDSTGEIPEPNKFLIFEEEFEKPLAIALK